MKKTTGVKTKFRKGDKFFIALISLFAFLVPVIIVYTSASLSSSNIELEKLKKLVETQSNVNASLSMQVDELASLSKVQDIAKFNGLSYNNDNIIIIK